MRANVCVIRILRSPVGASGVGTLCLVMQEIPGQAVNTTRYIYGGYQYHIDTTSVHLFRCSKRSSIGCGEAARVNEDQSIDVYIPHVGHEPNHTILEELGMQREMKAMATDTNLPLKQIFDDVCRRNPLVAPNLLWPKMKGVLQRARNKVRPIIPQSLRELATALDTYAPTESVYRGLIESDDGNVALIFSSNELLGALDGSREIFVDGTFKVAPYHPRIIQLYTVHIRVMDTARDSFIFNILPQYTGIAAVYILCRAKTRALYEAVFRKICELAPLLRVNLGSIMGDYERAAMSALRAVFPGARLHGCWFHFNQALERKWRQLGLSGAPTHILAKAMALPLAPADRFDEGLALLAILADAMAEEHPSILSFMRYLRRQWRPLAEVVSVNGCPTRTNNLVESFHGEAKRKLGGLHPNIWKFIEYLGNLIVNQGIDLVRLQNGTRPRRARTIRNMARDTLIRDAQHALSVDRFTLSEFLERCANRTGGLRVALNDAVEEDAALDDQLVEPGLMEAGEPRDEARGVRRGIRANRRNRAVRAPIVVAQPVIHEPVGDPDPIRAVAEAPNVQHVPLPAPAEDQDADAIAQDEPYNEADFHIPEDDFEVFQEPEEPIPFHPIEAVALDEINGPVRPRGICCVCLAEPATHAFIPCGHRHCCQECAQRIADDLASCPICRQLVRGLLRIHADT